MGLPMAKRRARRLGGVVLLSAFAGLASADAHHMSARREGGPIGVLIPAISHGQMPVIARYRAEIMDLADRQPRTDPTLRRLQGFVSLQYFACFRGLAPASLSDEGSPFNECAHAYLAGTSALLDHMAEMSGDPSEAKDLQARIAADLVDDPGAGVICSNSNETFDSGIVVGPDWSLAFTQLPTLLAFLSVVTIVAGSLGFAFATRHRRQHLL